MGAVEHDLEHEIIIGVEKLRESDGYLPPNTEVREIKIKQLSEDTLVEIFVNINISGDAAEAALIEVYPNGYTWADDELWYLRDKVRILYANKLSKGDALQTALYGFIVGKLVYYE